LFLWNLPLSRPWCDGKAQRIGEPEDLPELILFNLIFGEKRSLERIFFQYIFSEAFYCPYMKISNIYLKTQQLSILLLLILLMGLSSLLAQSPKRIISLAPSLTKNLYLLEAEDLLVGCTNYCHLQSETDAQVVASAIQVNYEKAVMLKPDLIITTDLTKSKTIDTFKKLDVDVLVFKNPTSFSEICEQFIQLGEKVGKKELAENIIEDAKKSIEVIKRKVPEGTPKQKIFMQIGANPLFAVVPETFMNDFINFSGTENIFSDLTMGSVNREAILVRNPDIIVVVLMGTMGTDEKSRWEEFENLSAVKNKQVFTMNADNACSPTPLSFVTALDELIGLIYKE
jgi:iron complex transport system substrate-binding protein